MASINQYKIRVWYEKKNVIFQKMKNGHPIQDLDKLAYFESAIYLHTKFDLFLGTCIVGQKIWKSPGHKNSWNEMNQFREIFSDQIPFFAISRKKIY